MARIGVNALYLIPGGVGGTEIYLRELLAALARIDSSNDYFVFTNLETGADLAPKQTNFHWKPQAVRARFRPARILWEQIILPLEAARYRLDVLFNPGFTAPIFSAVPSVTVFHDLQHRRHPEYFRWFDVPFWRLLLWASARRSRTLVAVSEATREDLVRFYPFAATRARVIPHGVDEAFFQLDRAAPERYVLCVSTLHPHKNIDGLIRAYTRRKRDFKLVLAGMRGLHAREVEKLITGDIRVTGWIPRAELLNLYARAMAFIYPSKFEGFGMPVLEAMAAGIPVACSDIPPLREVAGDAALFFDPLDEDGIASALERITSDQALRKQLADAGPKRAREFTWQRSAELTLAALTQ
jgi:glycosyltransferase involved in cell wall biosynthesis